MEPKKQQHNKKDQCSFRGEDETPQVQCETDYLQATNQTITETEMEIQVLDENTVNTEGSKQETYQTISITNNEPMQVEEQVQQTVKEIQCQICTKQYTENYKRQPLTLPCGHALCRVCTEAWNAKQIAENEVPNCPFCRGAFDVSRLNPNIDLINVCKEYDMLSESSDDEEEKYSIAQLNNEETERVNSPLWARHEESLNSEEEYLAYGLPEDTDVNQAGFFETYYLMHIDPREQRNSSLTVRCLLCNCEMSSGSVLGHVNGKRHHCGMEMARNHRNWVNQQIIAHDMEQNASLYNLLYRNNQRVNNMHVTDNDTNKQSGTPTPNLIQETNEHTNAERQTTQFVAFAKNQDSDTMIDTTDQDITDFSNGGFGIFGSFLTRQSQQVERSSNMNPDTRPDLKNLDDVNQNRTIIQRQPQTQPPRHQSQPHRQRVQWKNIKSEPSHNIIHNVCTFESNSEEKQANIKHDNETLNGNEKDNGNAAPIRNQIVDATEKQDAKIQDAANQLHSINMDAYEMEVIYNLNFNDLDYNLKQDNTATFSKITTAPLQKIASDYLNAQKADIEIGWNNDMAECNTEMIESFLRLLASFAKESHVVVLPPYYLELALDPITPLSINPVEYCFNYSTEYDILLMPICFPGHFGLIIVDRNCRQQTKFIFIDPKPHENNTDGGRLYNQKYRFYNRDRVLRIVDTIVLLTPGLSNTDVVIENESTANYTTQSDGWNCGFYVLLYAEAYLFNNRNMILSKLNIKIERKRILYHLARLCVQNDALYIGRYLSSKNQENLNPVSAARNNEDHLHIPIASKDNIASKHYSNSNNYADTNITPPGNTSTPIHEDSDSSSTDKVTKVYSNIDYGKFIDMLQNGQKVFQNGINGAQVTASQRSYYDDLHAAWTDKDELCTTVLDPIYTNLQFHQTIKDADPTNFCYQHSTDYDILLITIFFPNHFGLIIVDRSIKSQPKCLFIDPKYFSHMGRLFDTRYKHYKEERLTIIMGTIRRLTPDLGNFTIDPVNCEYYTPQSDAASCGFYVILYAESYLLNSCCLLLKNLDIIVERKRILYLLAELSQGSISTYTVKYIPRNCQTIDQDTTSHSAFSTPASSFSHDYLSSPSLLCPLDKKSNQTNELEQMKAQTTANLEEISRLKEAIAKSLKKINVIDNPLVHTLFPSYSDACDQISVSKHENAQLKSGTVQSFNDQKGYGFIVQEDTGASIFVHISNVLSKQPLRKGQKVKFELGEDIKGWYATNVVESNKRAKLN